MKQLIILSQAPLTPQIRRNCYIDEFINAGYTNIEFWDISQYLHPGIKLKDELQDEHIKYIPNIETLSASIDNLNVENSIFILDFPQGWNTRHLFRVLSDKECIYVRIDMYANTYLYISKWKQLSKLFSKQLVHIIKEKTKSILYNFYTKKYHIQPFKRYYSSSALSKVNRTDKINHPDYEELKYSPTAPAVSGKYILFIDTYFGYHPDDKFIYKYSSHASPEEYQKSLKNFFSYLEQKYKMPVIIAAHPKSDYAPDTFGGREIIKYKTKDLVCFADKIILQLCNTISWVTLVDKPFIFITTKGYEMYPLRRRRLRMLAQILGMGIFNIDTCNWDNITFTNVTTPKRLDYIYTYLTDKEIENKKNIDILTHSFESL